MFGPEVRIGWSNRIMMLVNLGWLIVIALAIAQPFRQAPEGNALASWNPRVEP